MIDEKAAAEKEEAAKKEAAIVEIRATVAQAVGLGVDPDLLARGVKQAKLNCAEQAALQMAYGLPAINFWGHIVRLQVVEDEIAKANFPEIFKGTKE